MRKAQGHGRQARLQYILSQGVENNHYKLPPLRITTSIFKITKMSLEKGAVSCPRSKLLRRGPEIRISLYSTFKHGISTALLWLISLMSAFCATMIPQSTLKTQVITLYQFPGYWSVKQESPVARILPLWKLLRPNSDFRVETPSFLAAMKERKGCPWKSQGLF